MTILLLIVFSVISFGQINRSGGVSGGGLDTAAVQSLISEASFSSSGLMADRTINIDNSMTVSEIQDSIDTVPKNLNNYVLTINFANGTYSLGANTILIEGFYGGEIYLLGDETENSASADKNVLLNFAASANGNIAIEKTEARVYIYYLKISVPDQDVFNAYAVYAKNSNYLEVMYCSFASTGRLKQRFVAGQRTVSIAVEENYIQYGLFAFQASVLTRMFCNNNYIDTDTPLSGYVASSGGYIMKIGASVTAFGTLNQAVAGGVVVGDEVE